MVDALGPADIGNVDEAIDAILDLHKRAKSGEAFYLAGEYGSDGEVIFNGKPGVGIHLFHTQGDALVFLIQFQHDGIHRVADLEYLAGIGDLLGPAHFRDVYQAFHSGLQFHKSAERFDADYLAGYPHAFRILDLYVFPRMGYQLFESQGDLVCLCVELNYFHFDLVADREHFGGVTYLAPAHIGDMQEAVNASKVDESAILSNIFHLSIQFGIDLELGKQLGSLFQSFLFQYLTAGKDNVPVFLIEADYLEAHFFSNELVKIGDGFQ